MPWKIFKVTYNDGGWHSGDLLHFYYIAHDEEEVKAKSQRYADFVKSQKYSNGDIWIHEFDGINYPFEWENLNDFKISLSVEEKINV